MRLVTATNRDLKKEIAEGNFREDLYYRLNVVPLFLPPLRDRADDVPALVHFFLSKFNERLGKSLAGVAQEAMDLLMAHPWPGNVRELENIMERAVLFADGEQVQPADLPPELRGSGGKAASGGSAPAAPAELGNEGLKEQVKAATSRLERDLIVRALDQTGGNVTHAARLLKISRKGLQLKMKELELRERDSP